MGRGGSLLQPSQSRAPGTARCTGTSTPTIPAEPPAPAWLWLAPPCGHPPPPPTSSPCTPSNPSRFPICFWTETQLPHLLREHPQRRGHQHHCSRAAPTAQDKTSKTNTAPESKHIWGKRHCFPWLFPRAPKDLLLPFSPALAPSTR